MSVVIVAHCENPNSKNTLSSLSEFCAYYEIRGENSKKAIYWLIKSAEQGNEEATSLLQQCLKTGQGITCQNISDVRSCVATPKNEKLVFKAARRLHDKLSNGEEFITTSQILGYQQSNIKSDIFERFPLLDDLPNKTFTIHDDEETQDSNETETDPSTIEENSKEEREELKRLLDHEGVKLTRADLLQIAKLYTSGNVPNISISGQIHTLQDYQTFLYSTSIFLLQLLLLSVFMKALTVHSVLLVVLSWIVIVTCLKLLAWPKKLAIFHEWTSAFHSVLQNNSPLDFSNETKMASTQLQPIYIFSFITLGFLYFLGSPPELTFVLGIISVWGILHGAMSVRFSWQTIFMITTTLASAPGLSAMYSQSLEFIDNQMESFHIFSMEPITSSEYFKLFRSMDFQVAIVVVNLAIIAESYLHSRRFLDVIEHFVLYLWFLRMMASVVALTINGVYFCTGAFLIIAVTFYLVESRKDTWKIIAGATFATVLVALIGLTWAIYNNDPELNHRIEHPIFWEEYKTNCHRKAWETKTIPETRIDCWQLYERSPAAVLWTGKITTIKVTNIQKNSVYLEDSFEVSFDILVNVDSFLKEVEGSSWQNLLTGHPKEKEILSIVSVLVSTKDVTGVDAKKLAVKRILNLRIGDIIQFQGNLVSGAGSLKPEVQLRTLRCIDCVVPEDVDFIFTADSVTNNLLSPFEEYIGSQPIFILREIEDSIRISLKNAKDYYQYFWELFSQ
ncbi:unnamed protein product [Allacma fusca]|uniref:Wolframin cysteine-rich domain-containing protein n=1 Tax=Allacma fusca TaxID=39272 RepID=A0A8J2NSV5_9HEXA|nr:unnamed protein product [Allacma fusca]